MPEGIPLTTTVLPHEGTPEAVASRGRPSRLTEAMAASSPQSHSELHPANYGRTPTFDFNPKSWGSCRYAISRKRPIYRRV